MPKFKQGFLWTVLTGCLFWCGNFCPGVWAGYEYRMETHGPEMGQFESEMSGKLTRGLVNVLYGWTEIVRGPVEMAVGPTTGALKAVAFGVPYGIFRATGRTLVGVYEAVTCYAPQKPIMRPIEGDVL